MKQFQTLLKVKSYQETELIEELSSINDLIYNTELIIKIHTDKINNYKDNFNMSNNPLEQLSLRAIITSITKELKDTELSLKVLFNKKDIVMDSLISLRQEIKSVEKLIDKKEEQFRIDELHKEQEILDEINILE